MPGTTLSRAARAHPYLFALQDAGVDVESRLCFEALPSRILYEPDLVVSARNVLNFVDRTARKQGIKGIALLASQQDAVQGMEPWARNYMFGATTLHQLLKRFWRVAQRYTSFRHYWIVEEENLVRICTTADSTLHGEDFLRLSDWTNVLLPLKVLRRVLGPDFRPTAVTFQTKAPLTVEEQEALHGIRVLQGWTTVSIALPKGLLATPIPEAMRSGPLPEPPLESAGALSFSAQMRRLLKPCLAEDWLDVNTAADMAGCSARTFQRRLSATGLSFSQLLDQARMDVARALLEQQETRMIDIGMEVGFKDASHFSRAFRRVNGVTPSQYRQSIMAKASDLSPV